jgi:hypothetical protein
MADNYEVQSQQETATFDAHGNAARGMEITAKSLPSNVTFTVTVPEADYTQDKVTALLSERANVIEGIHAS